MNKMPPLPSSEYGLVFYDEGGAHELPGRSYTADQMHAYARAYAEQRCAPLTPREIELIDGMIDVQLHHARQCDGISNRTMAEKQKGWDMERVALLQKLRAQGITGD